VKQLLFILEVLLFPGDFVRIRLEGKSVHIGGLLVQGDGGGRNQDNLTRFITFESDFIMSIH